MSDYRSSNIELEEPPRRGFAPLPPAAPEPPETPLDAGSQALSDALRSSFSIVRILMVVLVLVFIFSGVFTVKEQERAIVLRLGKPVGEGEKALLGPGLHLSWPYPIGEYIKVSISGLQKLRSTSGWYPTTPEMELAGTEPFPGPTLNPAADGYAQTADGNIIHTRTDLTYRIKDPVRYLFNFANAPATIQNALDDALLQTAARFNVDDILTRNVIGFQEAVTKRVKELVEQEQNLGIEVGQCVVQSIPPRQVKDAFASVLKAEVTRNKVLNDARSYENQILSRASADAQGRLSRAESERVQLVNEVQSQAERFKVLLPQFQANPQLFVQQRIAETMSHVLTNVQDKILVPEAAPGQQLELRYNLNRELPKPKTEETPR